MRIALLFFLLGTVPLFGQSREEKETFRSNCFSGKIEVTKTHATAGEKNGELLVELPNGAGNASVLWISYGSTKKEKNIKDLTPGFYNLMIIDGKNCQTVIDNIQIKESQ
jgi:hypothetical protein